MRTTISLKTLGVLAIDAMADHDRPTDAVTLTLDREFAEDMAEILADEVRHADEYHSTERDMAAMCDELQLALDAPATRVTTERNGRYTELQIDGVLAGAVALDHASDPPSVIVTDADGHPDEDSYSIALPTEDAGGPER